MNKFMEMLYNRTLFHNYTNSHLVCKIGELNFEENEEEKEVETSYRNKENDENELKYKEEEQYSFFFFKIKELLKINQYSFVSNSSSFRYFFSFKSQMFLGTPFVFIFV